MGCKGMVFSHGIETFQSYFPVGLAEDIATPCAIPVLPSTVSVEPYGIKTLTPPGLVPVSPVIGMGSVGTIHPLLAFIIDGE